MEDRYEDVILLTGDVHKSTLAELEGAREVGLIKKVTLLSLSHHGSETGTDADWLKLTRPRFIVVSAGLENSYHHPRCTVVEMIVAPDTSKDEKKTHEAKRGAHAEKLEDQDYLKRKLPSHYYICAESEPEQDSGFVWLQAVTRFGFFSTRGRTYDYKKKYESGKYRNAWERSWRPSGGFASGRSVSYSFQFTSDKIVIEPFCLSAKGEKERSAKECGGGWTENQASRSVNSGGASSKAPVPDPPILAKRGASEPNCSEGARCAKRQRR